ncbi:Hypothetical_protein [Hexamita inflata]|uniref:Hypothetical_protein n=1 Tax=Hexamita inflata TaxID=28002 RepID=A0AA86V612_9EUKA|nr:Hypothetical protein HINF_LOCUS45363 [Hexamita inflata]
MQELLTSNAENSDQLGDTKPIVDLNQTESTDSESNEHQVEQQVFNPYKQNKFQSIDISNSSEQSEEQDQIVEENYDEVNVSKNEVHSLVASLVVDSTKCMIEMLKSMREELVNEQQQCEEEEEFEESEFEVQQEYSQDELLDIYPQNQVLTHSKTKIDEIQALIDTEIQISKLRQLQELRSLSESKSSFQYPIPCSTQIPQKQKKRSTDFKQVLKQIVEEKDLSPKKSSILTSEPTKKSPPTKQETPSILQEESKHTQKPKPKQTQQNQSKQQPKQQITQNQPRIPLQVQQKLTSPVQIVQKEPVLVKAVLPPVDLDQNDLSIISQIIDSLPPPVKVSQMLKEGENPLEYKDELKNAQRQLIKELKSNQEQDSHEEQFQAPIQQMQIQQNIPTKQTEYQKLEEMKSQIHSDVVKKDIIRNDQQQTPQRVDLSVGTDSLNINALEIQKVDKDMQMTKKPPTKPKKQFSVEYMKQKQQESIFQLKQTLKKKEQEQEELQREIKNLRLSQSTSRVTTMELRKHQKNLKEQQEEKEKEIIQIRQDYEKQVNNVKIQHASLNTKLLKELSYLSASPIQKQESHAQTQPTELQVTTKKKFKTVNPPSTNPLTSTVVRNEQSASHEIDLEQNASDFARIPRPQPKTQPKPQQTQYNLNKPIQQENNTTTEKLEPNKEESDHDTKSIDVDGKHYSEISEPNPLIKQKQDALRVELELQQIKEAQKLIKMQNENEEKLRQIRSENEKQVQKLKNELEMKMELKKEPEKIDVEKYVQIETEKLMEEQRAMSVQVDYQVAKLDKRKKSPEHKVNEQIEKRNNNIENQTQQKYKTQEKTIDQTQQNQTQEQTNRQISGSEVDKHKLQLKYVLNNITSNDSMNSIEQIMKNNSDYVESIFQKVKQEAADLNLSAQERELFEHEQNEKVINSFRDTYKSQLSMLLANCSLEERQHANEIIDQKFAESFAKYQTTPHLLNQTPQVIQTTQEKPQQIQLTQQETIPQPQLIQRPTESQNDSLASTNNLNASLTYRIPNYQFLKSKHTQELPSQINAEPSSEISLSTRNRMRMKAFGEYSGLFFDFETQIQKQYINVKDVILELAGQIRTIPIVKQLDEKTIEKIQNAMHAKAPLEIQTNLKAAAFVLFGIKAASKFKKEFVEQSRSVNSSDIIPKEHPHETAATNIMMVAFYIDQILKQKNNQLDKVIINLECTCAQIDGTLQGDLLNQPMILLIYTTYTELIKIAIPAKERKIIFNMLGDIIYKIGARVLKIIKENEVYSHEQCLVAVTVVLLQQIQSEPLSKDTLSNISHIYKELLKNATGISRVPGMDEYLK